jgi:hypothetical protein
LTTLQPVPTDRVWVFRLDVRRHRMAARRRLRLTATTCSLDFGVLTGAAALAVAIAILNRLAT